MHNKIILMVFIGLIVLMGLASADLGTYSQNNCVNIKTILNSSWVNISSLSYPNSSYAINNVGMTQIGDTFNYSFCSTNTIGTYLYDYFDNNGNVYANSFTITPTGTASNTQSSIIYLIFIIGSLFLFVLTLYGAIKIKWKHERNNEGKVVSVQKLRYFKPFLIAMCYIELMWIFAILYSITHNVLLYDSISPFFYWAYTLMLVGALPIVVVTLFFSLIVLVQDRKLRKKMSRGFNPR